jgi:hypothetical protein
MTLTHSRESNTMLPAVFIVGLVLALAGAPSTRAADVILSAHDYRNILFQLKEVCENSKALTFDKSELCHTSAEYVSAKQDADTPEVACCTSNTTVSCSQPFQLTEGYGVEAILIVSNVWCQDVVTCPEPFPDAIMTRSAVRSVLGTFSPETYLSALHRPFEGYTLSRHLINTPGHITPLSGGHEVYVSSLSTQPESMKGVITRLTEDGQDPVEPLPTIEYPIGDEGSDRYAKMSWSFVDDELLSSVVLTPAEAMFCQAAAYMQNDNATLVVDVYSPLDNHQYTDVAIEYEGGIVHASILRAALGDNVHIKKVSADARLVVAHIKPEMHLDVACRAASTNPSAKFTGAVIYQYFVKDPQYAPTQLEEEISVAGVTFVRERRGMGLFTASPSRTQLHEAGSVKITHTAAEFHVTGHVEMFRWAGQRVAIRLPVLVDLAATEQTLGSDGPVLFSGHTCGPCKRGTVPGAWTTTHDDISLHTFITQISVVLGESISYKHGAATEPNFHFHSNAWAKLIVFIRDEGMFSQAPVAVLQKRGDGTLVALNNAEVYRFSCDDALFKSGASGYILSSQVPYDIHPCPEQLSFSFSPGSVCQGTSECTCSDPPEMGDSNPFMYTSNTGGDVTISFGSAAVFSGEPAYIEFPSVHDPDTPLSQEFWLQAIVVNHPFVDPPMHTTVHAGDMAITLSRFTTDEFNIPSALTGDVVVKFFIASKKMVIFETDVVTETGVTGMLSGQNNVVFVSMPAKQQYASIAMVGEYAGHVIYTSATPLQKLGYTSFTPDEPGQGKLGGSVQYKKTETDKQPLPEQSSLEIVYLHEEDSNERFGYAFTFTVHFMSLAVETALVDGFMEAFNAETPFVNIDATVEYAEMPSRKGQAGVLFLENPMEMTISNVNSDNEGYGTDIDALVTCCAPNAYTNWCLEIKWNEMSPAFVTHDLKIEVHSQFYARDDPNVHLASDVIPIQPVILRFPWRYRDIQMITARAGTVPYLYPCEMHTTHFELAYEQMLVYDITHPGARANVLYYPGLINSANQLCTSNLFTPSDKKACLYAPSTMALDGVVKRASDMQIVVEPERKAVVVNADVAQITIYILDCQTRYSQDKPLLLKLHTKETKLKIYAIKDGDINSDSAVVFGDMEWRFTLDNSLFVGEMLILEITTPSLCNFVDGCDSAIHVAPHMIVRTDQLLADDDSSYIKVTEYGYLDPSSRLKPKLHVWESRTPDEQRDASDSFSLYNRKRIVILASSKFLGVDLTHSLAEDDGMASESHKSRTSVVSVSVFSPADGDELLNHVYRIHLRPMSTNMPSTTNTGSHYRPSVFDFRITVSPLPQFLISGKGIEVSDIFFEDSGLSVTSLDVRLEKRIDQIGPFYLKGIQKKVTATASMGCFASCGNTESRGEYFSAISFTYRKDDGVDISGSNSDQFDNFITGINSRAGQDWFQNDVSCAHSDESRRHRSMDMPQDAPPRRLAQEMSPFGYTLVELTIKRVSTLTFQKKSGISVFLPIPLDGYVNYDIYIMAEKNEAMDNIDMDSFQFFFEVENFPAFEGNTGTVFDDMVSSITTYLKFRIHFGNENNRSREVREFRGELTYRYTANRCKYFDTLNSEQQTGDSPVSVYCQASKNSFSLYN